MFVEMKIFFLKSRFIFNSKGTKTPQNSVNLAFSQPKASQVASKCSVSNSNDRVQANPMANEPKKSDHNQNVLTTSNSAVGKRKKESTAGDKRDIEDETEAQEPPSQIAALLKSRLM